MLCENCADNRPKRDDAARSLAFTAITDLPAPHRTLNVYRVLGHIFPTKADNFRWSKPDERERRNSPFATFQDCEDSAHLGRGVMLLLTRRLGAHATLRVPYRSHINATVSDRVGEDAG